MRARRAAAAIGLAAASSAGWIGATVGARAQAIDPSRPRTIVVGLPPGQRTDRVDGARSGLAPTPLPTPGLHVEWRTPTGAAVEHAPLVDARGTVYVVGTRGEAIAIARDGVEHWRLATGALDPGPPALLSDDTLVWVNGAGEAVAVREAAVRWRARVGAHLEGAAPAPLPLDDGGVVVATTRDLTLLDAEGHERARASLPERVSGPLLSALGRVVAVTANGTVWTWVPGSPEPSRVGSFGSPPEGGAALAGDRTLVAVVAGQTTLAAVDLVRGTTTTRAVAAGGLWLGPPTTRGDAATLTLLGPTSDSALTVDASGRELAQILLATHPLAPRPDAGPAILSGVRAPLLADRAGALAFATSEGGVGIASMGTTSEGSVEIVSEVCPRPGALSTMAMPMQGAAAAAPTSVAGLAPLPPASIVVACRSGTVVALGGMPSASTSGKP